MGGALRACFLIPGLPKPRDHAGDLAVLLAEREGFDVVLALTEGVPPGAEAVAFGDATAVPVAAAASGEPFDIAIATTWQGTAQLFTVPAARYAFWPDGLAFRRLESWQPERFAAQLAYDLPVDFLATGAWLAAELAELRPDARCVLVPRPLVPTGPAFKARPPHDGPLRVVVDDRYALEPAASDERAVVAAVQAAGVELDVQVLEPGDGVTERAVKLAGADVVLHLSPVDGVLGTPLDGFGADATCLVAPAADAGDLVRHDENGLLADPGDVRGTARRLETLARDRELLARLRAGARETVRGWPSPADAADALAAGLEQLVATEPDPATRWPVRLMGDAIGGAAIFKQEVETLNGEVRRLEGDRTYKAAVAVRETLRPSRLRRLLRRAR